MNRIESLLHIKETSWLTLSARLFSRTATAPWNACLPFQGQHNRDGYGVIRVTDSDGRLRQMLAHRAAFITAHGAIEDDHIVHHKCFRRDCVRVSHLQAVTHAEHGKLHAAHNKKLKRALPRYWSRKRLDEIEIVTIAELTRIGRSTNWISRAMKLDRATVRRYRRNFEQSIAA